MSESSTKIHVGLTSARELELDVADPDTVVADLESAFKDGTRVLWVTDTKDHRHGIVVEKVAFIEIERTKHRTGVGFTQSQ